MRNLKKFFSIITISIIVMFLMSSNVLANYSTVIMSIVEDKTCTINLDEDSTFTKKMVSYDLNTKELTIELKVTNSATVNVPEGEIVFVLDNSRSMLEDAKDGKTRIELITSSTKTLINSLLKDNDNLKIGIVSFSTKSIDSEGTKEDASIVQTLTNNESQLDIALDSINASGYRTDLQAGIEVGKSLFSTNDTDKYMVILTDGLPNVCIYSDLSSSDQEIAKSQFYCDVVIDASKKALESLKSDNINVISMLTGISDPNEKPTSTCEYTYKQYYEKVFGTQENPTVGKFFYTEDKDADTVITKDILEALKPESKTLTDIVIDDIFPKDIANNFDYELVQKPNIGTVSDYDSSNRIITWTIDKLEPGETATLQYKLKLQEKFDQAIVDKVLNTNENVEITYYDYDEQKQDKENSDCPSIKLTEPPAEIPETGIGDNLVLIIGSTILTITLFTRFVVFSRKNRL